MWNGGGTLQVTATRGHRRRTRPDRRALTKGTAGTYIHAGSSRMPRSRRTSYTLAIFASTTFSPNPTLTLELPVGDTRHAGQEILDQPHVYSCCVVRRTLPEAPPSNAARSRDLPGDSFSSFSPRSDSPASPSDLSLTPTPEPTSAALLAFGGAALLGWRRRRDASKFDVNRPTPRWRRRRGSSARTSTVQTGLASHLCRNRPRSQ